MTSVTSADLSVLFAPDIAPELAQRLRHLVTQAQHDFAAAPSHADLENAKARFLGKSGAITALMKDMVSLSIEDKKKSGAAINAAKHAIEAALQQARGAHAAAQLQAKLEAERLDVTLPGLRRLAAAVHPVTRSMERIDAIFRSMGFDVADGPEIETDWFSFTALNNPPNHPARSMQDTFYVDMQDAQQQPLNLRPHASPMQLRYALSWLARHAQSTPESIDIRVIAPGRTYRVDSDATHSPMFHQVEGLWLGPAVSFKDLKFVLTQFCHHFFETEDLTLRFRLSYFPFTQPSAEVDIQFQTGRLAGKWLEVAGSGQVHSQVLRNMGLDPETTIGFAFGMGIDRLTMLRYGVSDLRQFFESDLRFLQQFA